MGIKQIYNDNLRKLPNEYGDDSVMFKTSKQKCSLHVFFLFPITKALYGNIRKVLRVNNKNE